VEPFFSGLQTLSDIRQVGLLVTHLTCIWKFSIQILNGLPTILAEDFMVFLTHPRQRLEYYLEIGQVSFHFEFDLYTVVTSFDTA
jgi:hypothetical protein